MADVITEWVLTCPECGHAKREVMPTTACQFFYECESCKAMLRPKRGDCCVFCSYGSVKCPPMQSHGLLWITNEMQRQIPEGTPRQRRSPRSRAQVGIVVGLSET